MARRTFALIFIIGLALAACSGGDGNSTPAPGGLRVIAAESFLADIAQNVAGDRLTVTPLVPNGLDPHAFEPAPRDAAAIAEADVLIINGAGFEEWLEPILANTDAGARVIEASAGLQPLAADDDDHPEGDPHFWLDPTMVVTYVENIRDGLSAADPSNAAAYQQNAAAYITQLTELDADIEQQVSTIPSQKRVIVTNHESFGYFANRYGFTIAGAVIPAVTSSASPSAQQMAALVDRIRQLGVRVIFLETGANPDLAQTIAAETGIQVVTDLYTHSLSAEDGPAPTYLAMMRHNAATITAALGE